MKQCLAGGFVAISARGASVDQMTTDARTLAGAATAVAVAPKPLRAALAPWTAELAVLLLRLSAVALLLSPALLAAALLLG